MALLELQPDATAGIDTWLWSSNPDNNWGTFAQLWVGEVAGANTRTLIKFDLSSIPAGATINSAVLSLYDEATGSATNTRTMRVYRAKRVWVEDQATWNIYSTGNNWQTAGGFGADDCEQTDIGSLSIAFNAPAGFKDVTLTAAVKEDLDLGNGWLIKMDTETEDQHRFTSSDGVEAQRPKLVIDYTEGGGGGGTKAPPLFARPWRVWRK